MTDIVTKTDYEHVMQRINRLFDLAPVPGAPECAELDELARAVRAYELRTIPEAFPCSQNPMTVPITYDPGFMAKSVADDAFTRLRDELVWVRRDTTPRLEYYSNRHELAKPYTYGSGEFARTYDVQPCHDVISMIEFTLSQRCGCIFEVCFLNRYLDQSMHLGWHSDNSPEMDDGKPIAIVSLGAEREIWFRQTGKFSFVEGDMTKLTLGHGSLCLMAPGMQDTHQHRIPKSSRQCGERISLTFRGYVP